MKVVLFCGGYGMRMRDSSGDGMPKPMQMVGPRPLIWHVMRYYAHFGHKEFILCLGYGAAHIKNYFLTYQEAASNDFVMRNGQVELMHSDISDWSITFVDTGLESAIGERLRRVRSHLDGEEYFLANYADVLTDAPMDDIVEKFHASGAAASMMVVPPQSSFHCVEVSRGRRGQGPDAAIRPLSLGERRVLRAFRGSIRSGAPRRRPCCGRLRHPRGRGSAVWISARRFLEAGRHVQGTCRTRRRLPSRRSAVDALGPRRFHTRRRCSDHMILLSTGTITEIAVLGAHCDDIAIGMGGTLLSLSRMVPGLRVRALVLSGGGTDREAEEKDALPAFCPGADLEVTVIDIPDGRAPAHWERIKVQLSEFRAVVLPASCVRPTSR